VLFHDRHLPRHYAPFNVYTAGATTYVSYARQQPGSTDEAHGAGFGILDAYTHDGCG